VKLPVRRRRLTVREDNFVADAIARHRLLAGPRRGARQSPAPGDERSATDVIAEVPEREFPYGRQPACGPDTNAFRRLGATFTPRPAAETAPMAVAAQGERRAGDVLAQVRDGLLHLDLAAVAAARGREGLTYAHTAGAPFHNALLTAWHSPVRPARRHGEAVRRRAEALAYPSYFRAEVAGHSAYADVMRHADRITGTQGSGVFRLALPSGGAR